MSVGEKKGRIADSLNLRDWELFAIKNHTNGNKTRKTPSENTERDTQPWNLQR